jgi:hypothetical protein
MESPAIATVVRMLEALPEITQNQVVEYLQEYITEMVASMSPKKKVTALFDDIAANMLQFFEGWDTHVPHEGEKGGIRERRVRDFLESHLPDKYGVASGHIIDKKGTVSLQEDIVIFDRINSPVLRIDPYYQVFPCESVYATVEVKSTLDPGEIEKCIEHTRRLGELDRSDHRGELGPIENFVFAYDSYDSAEKAPSVWARDKFKEIASSGATQRPIPSAILCLTKSFVLRRDSPNSYVTLAFASGALLYFFSTLLHRVLLVKTAPPLLFTHYGWVKGSMIEYDDDGNVIPIIGIGVGVGKSSKGKHGT